MDSRRDIKGWVLDSDAPTCQLCLKSFTLTFRRHHCRNCGLCICNLCSDYKEIVPTLHLTKKFRVCYKCKAVLAESDKVVTPSESIIKPVANSELGDYAILKTIGKGPTSEVSLVIHKRSNAQFALKSIKKSDLEEETSRSLKQEIETLSKLSHPSIIELHDHHETEENWFFVYEYMRGGVLFDSIIEQGPFSEKETVSIMRQILEGLAYAHLKKIAHRDLKPENIMLVNPRGSKDTQIKISDWGLSKEATNLTTTVGTPDYVAPEILMGQDYSVECDIWSAGVIFYVLLSGSPPFGLEEGKELFDRILQANYTFEPTEQWEAISEDAKDMIGQMLRVDPDKRISAVGALSHSFFSQNNDERVRRLKSGFSLANFRKFSENRRRN